MTRSPATNAPLHWLRAENTLLRLQLDILTHIATGCAHDVDTIPRLRAADRHEPTTPSEVSRRWTPGTADTHAVKAARPSHRPP